MKKLPNDPVIVAVARTPVGKYGGMLSSIRPDDLLAHVIKDCLLKSKVDPDLIDEVVIGCANQAGEDNRNIARMSSLLAGLKNDIPAITVNRLCASGMDAIMEASRRIISAEHKLVLAGGVESMSRAPYVLAKQSSPFTLQAPLIFDTALGWRFYNENMRERTPPESNGETAEHLSKVFGINRNEQDKFALLSHQKAVHAQEQGFFEDEIAPLISKKEGILLTNDEGPRKNTSLDALATLKPAFSKNGTVTAGNSSSLNDGAAILLVSSYEFAKSQGLNILGRILGFSSAGIDPRTMGLGPVPSTKKLCEKYGFLLKDFEAYEINEAFAVQVLAVIKELNLNPDLVNQNGGAIAIGHPLGCSGTRILMTLLNHLRKKKKNLGLATMCVGVGQGVSMAIEAL